MDQSANLFALPSLDNSEITVPTPTLSPAAAATATPPSGIGNISPIEDIPYPQWGDFVPTTTPVVAGQQLTPPAAASNEPALEAANGNTFLLPTSSEQATPIDYYQQQTPTTNENGDDFFASLLPPPPAASGQNDGTNFKNLAVPQTGKNLDSAPSTDLGVDSTDDSLGADNNGEILQFVPGIGKKLRVRRNGGKWRAMV